MLSNRTGAMSAAFAGGLTLRQRVALACAVAIAITTVTWVAPLQTASAADYPGADEVRRAKAAVANAAASVRDLDAAIIDLENALHKADVAQRLAQEEYAEAQWQNVQAQRQLFAANNRAVEAEEALEEARDNLAVLAMAAYREGNSFGSLEALVSANGFEDVISRIEAQDRAAADAQVIVEHVRAAELVARTMREYAQEAADAAVAAEQAAADAYVAAVAAQKAAEQAVQEAHETREDLIAKLAQLRSTSQRLERERQAGLEQERREREAAAAERRQREAEEAARKAAEEEAARKAAEEEGSDGTTSPTETTTSAATTTTTSAPTTTSAATTSTAPVYSGGGRSISTAAQGQAAVDFAKSQINKPYVLGAKGPDAYDCSGLASASWAAAGIIIPRTSRTIYPAVGHLSYSQRRPGDLMFWGSGGDPARMYHVAIYIGNNLIIEGASPRQGIQIRDWRNWARSDMMPYIGRP